MPELPEVETTRRGIEPHILGQQVTSVIVRQPALRWRVPGELKHTLPGLTIDDVARRAKYLLLRTQAGTVIMHLGMSGSLRIVDARTPVQTHDHVDIGFAHGQTLRLRDPRRFGAVLWTRADPLQHALLKNLGPEPLEPDFNGAYLHRLSRGRRVAVKEFIMNSRVVAGVGNIYANEALFIAGIHPRRAAGRIAAARYEQLAHSIKFVLGKAIGFGGTTLRDFVKEDGRPGYFRHELCIYDRANEPCLNCQSPIRLAPQGQRATYYCPKCQR